MANMNILKPIRKKIPKIIPKQKSHNSNLPKNGGIVVGYEKSKSFEKIYYIDDDLHTMILGATRSGKTRCILIQSICFIALSGENMVISDPKAELFEFTHLYLSRLGYELIPLDFRSPLKSVKYNFLQPIIDAFAENDTAKAVDKAWDLTSSLVGEPKGERIWTDGEAAIIAGSIMSVVFDNLKNPQYQNMSNVYNFISNMCRPGEKGELPLNKYIDELDDNHPAKAIFAVSLLAPSRTRGSFFTAALATLRLFTNPNIYSMTCESKFNLKDTGNKKRALFIILPDEKITYHSLASLFVNQQYIALVETAQENGARLPRRVNFILEEFGNFTKIPSLSSFLTVGGGYGVRFNFIIQAYSMIEEKYGKETAETIKNNCNYTIYLRSESPATNKEISERLGKYTTSSYGRSNSTSKNNSSSASMNLIGRELLTPDEVSKIARPFILLLIGGSYPVITKMPDISKWLFNIMLGMGDKEHNIKLRMLRQSLRKSDECKPLELWGIWHTYKVGGIVPTVQAHVEMPESSPEENDADEAETDIIDEATKDMRLNDIHKHEN